jgi:hypothetical protein
MPEVKEPWQPSRLIPVTGLGGADEQERRGCSAFLAVLTSVREFGRAITGLLGAPAGSIETFIEVPFALGEKKYRPDGLIRVRRGQRTWTALVEVKTGRNCLRAEQVGAYVEIARAQGFDAVLTISNEIATITGECPVSIPRRKLNKVTLHHMSWSRIHTEALIERANHAVSDPDQAWILSEFIRYLEYEKSGAIDFDDMGPSWVAVRDAAALQTLRATDHATTEVVARYNQLVIYAGMRLSRQLGVYVHPLISRKDRENQTAKLQKQAVTLAKIGRLEGSLVVPDAVGPLVIGVDLRAGRVDVSMTTTAPQSGRPKTRVSWLLRQLKSAPPNARIKAHAARSRVEGPSRSLSEALEDPSRLLPDPQADVVSFNLTLSHPTGLRRGQGQGSFVGSVLDLVDKFYSEIAQSLKPWNSGAPQVKNPEAVDDTLGAVDELGQPIDRSEDEPENDLVENNATEDQFGVQTIVAAVASALPKEASDL